MNCSSIVNTNFPFRKFPLNLFLICFFAGFSLQAKSFPANLTNSSTVSVMDTVVKNLPPLDVPIGDVAPHIPVMLKTDGQDNSFRYGGYIYDKNVNVQNLKNWINQYPDEVNSYNKIIKDLFKQYKNDANNQSLRPIYIDSKAQYKLIKKLLK